MDRHTPEQRSRNMKRIRSKDTAIELKLRKALWHAGIHYRKNYPGVPGHPDIAITKYKIAVFCDSAFFHGKDYETRKKPETNADFWKKKIERNMERDREVNKVLQEIGWTVIRFWDDDINKRLDECVEAVKEAVFKRSVR